MARVLIAPDKFKGTHPAAEVAAAIAAGVRGPDAPDLCPVADGGEGTAEILLAALGGEWVEARAPDPLGRPIDCRWAALADGSAVVEVAEASGLWRLAPDELDPIAADSAGAGELIAAAIAAGADRVLVACGGSATVDAGAGALSRFDPASAEIVCLCDTRAPFMGALSFAPQKGAGEAELAELERRLAAAAEALPHDPRRLPFTGAAGGLSGALWAHGAKLVGGADHVLGAIGFDQRLQGSTAVITGEGALDETTLSGKAVGEVAARAARAGVPCHAITGVDRLERERERFASISVAGTLEQISAAAAALPV